LTSTGLNSGVSNSAPAAAPPQNQPPEQPQSSLRSIAVVTTLTLIQLLLQFATQVVLANYFGAGREMDAYVAALAPPVVVATILSGSLGYVLVPILAGRRAAAGDGDPAAVAAQLGLYVVLLALALCCLFALAASPLAALLCPGFTAEEQLLTASLLRVSSILIVANSLIAYLNALFHAYRRFARPAMAGVAGTLVTLGYVIALHDHYHPGIFAVAWAVVAGAAVTVAILAPQFVAQVWQTGAWRLPLQPGTRRCLALLTPLVLAAIYWRLDPLLDRYLGSRLPTGNIAHMGYAWRLISGLMLIGTSGLSIVAFPAIAAHAAQSRRDEMNAELAHALRFFLFLIVPVCIGLGIFATPVVRLLFERGKFSVEDTQAVSLLVVLYLGVVFGAGLGDLLSRTFYSLQDMIWPVVISTAVFTLVAGLKFLVVGRFGAAGLVAATSLYYLLNAAVLAVVLLARLSLDMLKGSGWQLVRSFASSLIACLVAAAVIRLPTPAAVLPAAIGAAAAYVVAAWLMGDAFAKKLIGRLLPGMGK
jgi:putative peptidoglycan lipid II flippase